MTDEQKTAAAGWTTAAAAIAAILGAFAQWGNIEPALDWILRNLAIIGADPHFRSGVIAIGVGAMFGLFWPWALPGRLTSARAQTSIRILSGLVSFAVAFVLMPTREGIVLGLGYMFGGPMVGMALVRRLCAIKSLPTPPALVPTTAEVRAVVLTDTKPTDPSA